MSGRGDSGILRRKTNHGRRMNRVVTKTVSVIPQCFQENTFHNVPEIGSGFFQSCDQTKALVSTFSEHFLVFGGFAVSLGPAGDCPCRH